MCLSFPTAPFIAASLRPAVIPLLIVTGFSSSETRTKHPIHWSRNLGISTTFNITVFPSLYIHSFADLQQKGYLIQVFPCLWWEFIYMVGWEECSWKLGAIQAVLLFWGKPYVLDIQVYYLKVICECWAMSALSLLQRCPQELACMNFLLYCFSWTPNYAWVSLLLLGHSCILVQTS